jgi:hypothetical protein
MRGEGYPIIRIMLGGFAVLAAWKLTHWKKWRKYYPTVLFLVATNLLSSVITQHHRLWVFLPSNLFPTHSLTDLFHTLVTFPATVFIYLSLYPKNLLLQICHVLLWILIFSGGEYLTYRMALLRYDNGWSFSWSVFINCLLFPILRIHYSSPILAWILYFTFLLLIWNVFGFSIEMLQ